MSILADFFVSTPEVATAFEAGRWPAVDLAQVGGFLPFHFELLWAVLQGKEWDETVESPFEELGDASDTESWLVRFPNEFVERLASATREELNQARVEWAQMEELSVDPDDLTDVVEVLQGLCRNAVASGRAVYLSGSV